MIYQVQSNKDRFEIICLKNQSFRVSFSSEEIAMMHCKNLNREYALALREFTNKQERNWIKAKKGNEE